MYNFKNTKGTCSHYLIKVTDNAMGMTEVRGMVAPCIFKCHNNIPGHDCIPFSFITT